MKNKKHNSCLFNFCSIVPFFFFWLQVSRARVGAKRSKDEGAWGGRGRGMGGVLYGVLLEKQNNGGKFERESFLSLWSFSFFLPLSLILRRLVRPVRTQPVKDPAVLLKSRKDVLRSLRAASSLACAAL